VHDLRPGYRRARCLGCGVGNDRNRSGSDRLINEAIAVAGLTLHRDKNSSRAHPPGVIFETGNARISAAGQDLSAFEKLFERHWSDYK
jgi:hypothetical protein